MPDNRASADPNGPDVEIILKQKDTPKNSFPQLRTKLMDKLDKTNVVSGSRGA